jgi:iron complex outermembrane receptor protein
MRLEVMRLESIHRVPYLRVAFIAAGLCLMTGRAGAQASSPDPSPAPNPDQTPPPTPPPAEPPPPAAPPPVAAPPVEVKTTLRGVVTGDGGAPQVGATVSLTGTNLVVFTDEKGEYTVPVTPGTYAVRVEAPGAFPLEKTVVVGPDPATLDFQVAEDKIGEVINILGSRTPRSRLETSVPVDVVDAEVIGESGHSELNQMLNTIAPSFNASHLTITDGTDHIDPADLRSLGPEHVLVLVNGKRLHQSSLVNVYNGGTVGVDLNAIPTSAIARIEVLRDGAASQYGSDAIAGVINIVLKDNVDVTDFYTQAGLTGSGDGGQFKLGANTGFRLGSRGFVNVTGEFFARGKTNRSQPYSGNDIFPGIDPDAPDAAAQTNAELQRRGLTRDDFKMHVGDAGALVGTGFLNAGYKLNDVFELYADGGYTYRQGYASGFYRFPAQDAKSNLNFYPNGFLPQINPRLNSWTGTAGVRAKQGPVEGNLSLTYGGDSFHFFVDNSLNASLGDASPTNFNAGRLHFHQTSANLDGVYHIDQPVFKSLAVVAGAELRRENYGINAGQIESWEQGPVTYVDADGVTKPKLPGAQVFPGFRPTDASDSNRTSEAVYLGIESQPIARANLDVGGRFEHYSDFGSTVTGKVAGRVAVFKTADNENELAARGSASTGFRAPGLQQIHYSTIATQFINDPNNAGQLVASNILISPNQSGVTEAFGVPRLKEETSVNFSGGFTARLLGNLSVSADYYHVKIKNRIVLSGLFDKTDPVLGSEISSVLDPFPGVGITQFFVNAVDTSTNGVDVVVDYSVRLPKGQLKATAAASFTDTNVDAVHVPQSMLDKFAGIDGAAAQVSALFLSRYGRNRLEDLLPRQKATLGLHWDYAQLSAGVRGNFYGPTEYHAETGPDLDESFGAKVTADVDVGYRISSLLLTVGANNVFNTFPDEMKHEENRFNGSFLYSPASFPAGAPYGIDGGFYYVRAEYKY